MQTIPAPTPVVYSPKQVPTTHNSFSKSPLKPRMLADQIKQLKSPHLTMLDEFPPVSTGQLRLVHDPDTVQAITLGLRNDGFNRKPTANQVESILYTNGNFIEAYLTAAADPDIPGAISLTSGFHHAKYDQPSGFCTFNALMLAPLMNAPLKKTLIIDGDNHWGDGCVDILQRVPTTKDLIIYCSLPNMCGPTGFPTQLYGNICRLIANEGVEMVEYQAGADAYIHDPLGGYLTKEQLRQRDVIVFQACKDMGVPCVWNLAGGYCPDYNITLDIHMATVDAWLEVHYGGGSQEM